MLTRRSTQYPSRFQNDSASAFPTCVCRLIGALPGNFDAVTQSLSAHAPRGETPTLPALRGAIDHAIDFRNAHPANDVAVVLVTGTEQETCGSLSDLAPVAASGRMDGTDTYVIAVENPAVGCAADSITTAPTDFDPVAEAGSPDKAFPVDYSSDPRTPVSEAIKTIRDGHRAPFSCQFDIPKPPGQLFDKAKVNLEYTDQSGAVNEPYYVSSSQCDPITGGWYYDDVENPQKIILCEASCKAIGAEGDEVSILFGCDFMLPVN